MNYNLHDNLALNFWFNVRHPLNSFNGWFSWFSSCEICRRRPRINCELCKPRATPRHPQCSPPRIDQDRTIIDQFFAEIKVNEIIQPPPPTMNVFDCQKTVQLKRFPLNARHQNPRLNQLGINDTNQFFLSVSLVLRSGRFRMKQQPLISGQPELLLDQ